MKTWVRHVYWAGPCYRLLAVSSHWCMRSQKCWAWYWLATSADELAPWPLVSASSLAQMHLVPPNLLLKDNNNLVICFKVWKAGSAWETENFVMWIKWNEFKPLIFLQYWVLCPWHFRERLVRGCSQEKKKKEHENLNFSRGRRKKVSAGLI